jgi:hypothetical protein
MNELKIEIIENILLFELKAVLLYPQIRLIK